MQVSKRELEANYEVEPEVYGTAAFAAGADEGSSVAAGEIGNVLVAEIGEDGPFAAYEYVRLGQLLGQTGRSTKGKLFGDFQDGGATSVPAQTKFRWVLRPKNKNNTVPLTSWHRQRDLNQSDPSKRIELPPVKDDDGNPVFAKDGRELVLQVKNESQSVTVSQSNSDMDLPVRAWY